MLLLINVKKLCWYLSKLPASHCSQFSWKCFTGMRRHDIELWVLTWLHHVGMGPGEHGKQQADTDTCVYFYHLTLEKQLADRNVWMFVSWKEHFFKGAALSLSVFAGSSMIMLFSSLSLYLSLSFPFFSLSLSVHVLPEGEIRHEVWEQALQC